MAQTSQQTEASGVVTHTSCVRMQPGYDFHRDEAHMGRYRTRTWIRGHLPYALTWLAPKGEDCGDHDWYRSEDHVARCYHCEAGEHPLAPDDQVTPDGIVKTRDIAAVH